MGVLTVYRKTFGDLSNPKLIAAYFVPFLVVSGMMALGMTDDEFADLVTIAAQETALASAFAIIAFFLAVGFPFLSLGAVLTANTLAREAEMGTLRILLSKPTRRWTVLFGTYGAIVSYMGLVALASLLLSAVMLVHGSGVDAGIISGGIFAWLPGHVVFALFGSAVVTAVGFALAVVTKNRLRTALGALSVPVLYFAFFPIRIFAGDMYEDYALYLLDVNYHFGHAFVFVHEAVGGVFGVEIQRRLAMLTGVYTVPDEMSDTPPESLELAGHVPMEASVALLVSLAIGAFAIALFRFRDMDV